MAPHRGVRSLACATAAWRAHRGRVHSGRVAAALVIGGAVVVAALAAATTVSSFVPAASGRNSAVTRRPPPALHTSVLTANAASGEKEDYGQYDWQRVAAAPEKPGTAAAEPAVDPDAFPDLPDFPEPTAPSAATGVASLGARVKVKQVEIPDLPGDPDLLPPAPNPVIDGGLGLWEWTGIWIVGCLGIAALGGLGSYGLARAQIDPEFADKALVVCKYGLGLFQVLFLGRVLLTQFPKINTTEMPWAPVHYTTEWALAPTRAVFKPEAGVDVAPILWLLMVLLASELLTGPSGILMMAKGRGAGAPPGMLPR